MLKKSYIYVLISIITILLFVFSVGNITAFAEEISSFNPTEPEIQLGDITEVGIIAASGEVKLDEKSSQGIITGEKLVEIDGVRGKGEIVYILDKQTQDIISLHSKDMKVTGEDGSVVQINEVDELIGKNGVADSDGFKSNLVPNTIPKTGLPPISPFKNIVIGVLILLSIGLIYTNYKVSPKRI